MNREKVIQNIALALSVLEGCHESDIEKVKKFLRWMNDDALQDVWDKHRLLLEKNVPMGLQK